MKRLRGPEGTGGRGDTPRARGRGARAQHRAPPARSARRSAPAHPRRQARPMPPPPEALAVMSRAAAALGEPVRPGARWRFPQKARGMQESAEWRTAVVLVWPAACGSYLTPANSARGERRSFASSHRGLRYCASFHQQLAVTKQNLLEIRRLSCRQQEKNLEIVNQNAK